MYSMLSSTPPPSSSSGSSSRSRYRSVAGVLGALSIGLAVVLSPASVAGAAVKKAKPKAPVAGGVCSPSGARAAGTSLDCVKVGTKLQWQPKGSKLNPFKLGETFEWTQSSNGTAAGALVSTRRLKVTGYLPDASGWVSSFSDNAPKDIFDLAKGVAVRGVQVDYTLVDATDESSRMLGSLSTFWLGTDADAGCCTQGLLNWGNPPSAAVDAYTRLGAAEMRSGVMVFARTDAQLTGRPLLRLAWLDVRTTKNQFVYFDVLPGA